MGECCSGKYYYLTISICCLLSRSLSDPELQFKGREAKGTEQGSKKDFSKQESRRGMDELGRRWDDREEGRGVEVREECGSNYHRRRRESSSQGSTSAAESFNWSLKPRELPEERGRREERLGAGREQSRREGQMKGQGRQEIAYEVVKNISVVNNVGTRIQPRKPRSFIICHLGSNYIY